MEISFFKWITEFADKYGLVGLTLILVLLGHFKVFDKVKGFLRNGSGREHSRKGDARDDNHYHQRTDDLTIKFEEHLKKEALEDIMITKLEGRIIALEDGQKHLYGQNKSIFEKFDAMNKKIDDGFNTLTKIILDTK